MIHPTAIVSPKAKLSDGVEIGAFTVIGDHVEIGSGTKIGSHAVIDGPTIIGKDNTISPFSSLGAPPQDKKYAGEATRLEIGDRNTIREFCTFNRGTSQDVGVTRVGNDNWIMARSETTPYSPTMRSLQGMFMSETGRFWEASLLCTNLFESAHTV
jgi:UDP-N-acetylglucosamine acyltransferase